MGQDILEVSINLAKMLVIFLAMVQAVPLLVWVERRGSAFIQMRYGPNRVGPFGLLQLLADAVKFIFKESFIPQKASPFLFLAAPVLGLVPAALALAVLPFSLPVQVEPFAWLGRIWGPYEFSMRGFDMDMGVLYILAISSLGAYALLVAGWASGNKYSLLGALRASAQMISYELALGFSVIAALLLYATFDLDTITEAQAGVLHWQWGGTTESLVFLPNWGLFFQPLGAIIFLVAAFAETNRLPFDLPETEAELVAGFHTEYGGFKMLVFFMGEYGHMIVASSLFTILYLGGYHIPWVSVQGVTETMAALFADQPQANFLTSLGTSLVFLCSFLLKVVALLWLFIWVRWTLPRFRYDHLMNLGWKTLLPWSLGNVVVTALFVYFSRVGLWSS